MDWQQAIIAVLSFGSWSCALAAAVQLAIERQPEARAVAE